MARKPTLIVFDLGNVLFHFDHARICTQLSELTGVPVGDIGGFIETQDLIHRMELGNVQLREVYTEFCQSFSVSPEIDSVELAASDIFQLNFWMVPLMGKLALANHRLAILSNTCQPHWDFLVERYCFLSKLFSLIALSYELHLMKPDPKIYHSVAELAGVDPEEIFFTDDREENVEAARMAGWQAVVFQNEQQVAEELRSRDVNFNL